MLGNATSSSTNTNSTSVALPASPPSGAATSQPSNSTLNSNPNLSTNSPRSNVRPQSSNPQLRAQTTVDEHRRLFTRQSVSSILHLHTAYQILLLRLIKQCTVWQCRVFFYIFYVFGIYFEEFRPCSQVLQTDIWTSWTSRWWYFKIAKIVCWKNVKLNIGIIAFFAWFDKTIHVL